MLPKDFLLEICGHEAKAYAAMKFFLFTQISGLLMLLAILSLVYFNYAESGVITFNYYDLLEADLAADVAFCLMLGFFIAFVVKLPGVPFHTWLPDAHTQAPTAGSVILASVLLKMGTYGFLRFSLPILPDATQTFTPVIMTLSVVAIIYGAYMAFAQTDLKKLIAYSSVSHMGFVTLGIFAWNAQGIEGAILQMVNHGITTGALFLCVGIIYTRTHSREIADNSGLANFMPCYSTFLVIFALSSVGLPGMNSFVGEFLVLIGVFVWSKFTATVAALGVILAAAYILWMLQRVVYGVPAEHIVSKLYDLNWRETGILIPLVVIVFWIWVYPKPVLDIMHSSVINIVKKEIRIMTAENPIEKIRKPPTNAFNS